MDKTLLDLIGQTPLVRLPLPATVSPNVVLLGKMEGNNPGGSVKDRAARRIILGAEERGELKPGQRIIEATSGNTGIALAMIASARGYGIDLVMPADSTEERVTTMRALGAKVILTPAAKKIEGSIDEAKARFEAGGYYQPNQFSNDDNWRAHYETTGPEIFNDTKGSVTHFVSAMGTTGTIMGVSRYLKEQKASIQIVGVQPTDGSKIPGIRRWPEAYLPKIFDPSRVDTIFDVSQSDAEENSRVLAKSGIFVGVSAAGAALAARRLCETLDSGVVVTVLCDRGDRYLSQENLFQGLGELEIVQ